MERAQRSRPRAELLLKSDVNRDPGRPRGLFLAPHVKIRCIALAGVAQWIECRPVNQRVAGLIPGEGTCLGCRPGAQ